MTSSLKHYFNRIDQLVGDDEITRKMIQNFYEELGRYLQDLPDTQDSGSEVPPYFTNKSDFIAHFWPYSSGCDIKLSCGLEPKILKAPQIELDSDYKPFLDAISRITKRKPTMTQLVAVSEFVSKKHGIPLKRKTKMIKNNILKWIKANWAQVEPELEPFFCLAK